MIVCLCNGVSDRALDDCIDAGATSVDDVGLMSGAGLGCGACRCTIEDRLACSSGHSPHRHSTRTSLPIFDEARSAA